jgi:4-hydroxyproline epimerase
MPAAEPLSRISVVDSHTGGEPTRVVLSGGPDLGDGPLAARRERFRREFDAFRSAVVCEPRGSDVLVGALLVPPTDPSCAAGVLFFNNVGYLGMCGHGTIGLLVTLAHLGRIGPGEHRVETPVGVVTTRLHVDGRVSVTNVPAYRLANRVPVAVPGYDGVTVTGDVAWGGNWFYLTEDHGRRLGADNVAALTDFALAVRRGLEAAGITGADGAEIDHVELVGPPEDPARANCRNFVLCPGGAWDRSPCGTGTSAKLACLHGDGKLAFGQVWRQESVLGSVFEGILAEGPGGALVPTIIGTAYVTAEATLLVAPDDPFRDGIPTAAVTGE